ncbi:CPXCG motif-containing cysteine-rich protein [Ascidiimonas aurantiaca]|uniref:CPXCG motif-containing cysteine-rich protein n=1 Tax=Ascidiimonas aurantiaca TaxID=1685432 RepID=UPI0030EEAFC6
MEEHFFQCPYCWEEISVLLDSSVTTQIYVEDCEVCCNPMEISISYKNRELTAFTAIPLGQ